MIAKPTIKYIYYGSWQETVNICIIDMINFISTPITKYHLPQIASGILGYKLELLNWPWGSNHPVVEFMCMNICSAYGILHIKPSSGFFKIWRRVNCCPLCIKHFWNFSFLYTVLELEIKYLIFLLNFCYTHTAVIRNGPQINDIFVYLFKFLFPRVTNKQ